MDNQKTIDTGLWFTVLGAALQIPGAKIDRTEFLSKEFDNYCDSATIDKMVKSSTVKAGIDLKLLDTIAENTINTHTALAAALSTAAGIPGGIAMLATIPADTTQYYFHVISIAQKLAYIYGFEQFEIAEDNFKSILTLLVGVMAGITEADAPLRDLFSAQIRKDVTVLVAVKALNKIVLRIALALSYRLTGKTLLASIWKAVPLISGLISGGITLATFSPMCSRLKQHLHDAVLRKPSEETPLLS